MCTTKYHRVPTLLMLMAEYTHTHWYVWKVHLLEMLITSGLSSLQLIGSILPTYNSACTHATFNDVFLHSLTNNFNHE